MKNYLFVIVDQNGPITRGIILKQMTDEFWLVKYTTSPIVTRVISINQIETWNLFENEQELGAFLTALVAKPAPEPEVKKKKKK